MSISNIQLSGLGFKTAQVCYYIHFFITQNFHTFLVIKRKISTHQCPWYEVLTSLTVKRNCIAHTRRQHKLRDSARAHSARVTSYTIVYSSGLIKLLGVTVNGEIFSRKIKESSANSRDTKHSRPRLVSVSLAPASWSLWFLDKDEDQGSVQGVRGRADAGQLSGRSCALKNRCRGGCRLTG